MSSELGIELHGAESDLPVDRVLAQLRALVEVLGLLEDGEVRRDRTPMARSTWSFHELAVGSVHARLRPLSRAADTAPDQLDRVPFSVVRGFGHAEESSDLPSGWGEDLAAAGRRVAERLGDEPASGMTLTLIEGGQEVRRVEVTRRAATNLKTASAATRTSSGSVIGTLAAVNTRTARAGLWTDLDDRRVRLTIGHHHLEAISANLGERVLVAGTLTRNAVGQVLSVKPDDITPWPRSRRSLSESAGVARGALGDEGPVEHLERVGGWASQP